MRSKKCVSAILDNPMFRRDIILSAGPTLEKALAWAKAGYLELKEIPSEPIPDTMHACVYRKDNMPTVLLLCYGRITHGIIAHECVHLTWTVFKFNGVGFSDESEEVFAYHTDWMVRMVYRFCQEHKIKVKTDRL